MYNYSCLFVSYINHSPKVYHRAGQTEKAINLLEVSVFESAELDPHIVNMLADLLIGKKAYQKSAEVIKFASQKVIIEQQIDLVVNLVGIMCLFSKDYYVSLFEGCSF